MPDAAQDEPRDWAVDAARVPALAGLTACLAILDLVVRRGVVRIMDDAVPHATRLAFEPFIRTLMNAVALSATIATFDAMAALLRRREAASFARRISMGALMLLFLPCIAIALFLPHEHTTFQLVLLGSMLAHVFAAQLSLGAFEHRGDLFIRLASVAVFGTTVGAIVYVTVSTIGPALSWAPSYEVSRAARCVGEISWALAPFFTLTALVRRDPGGIRARRSIVALVIALVAGVLFLRARAYVGSEYGALLYGGLHVQLLADGPAFPYALTVGVALGAAAHGALSRDGVDRQLAYGTACLLASGFAPHAPVELILLVTAAACFARALVAEAEHAPLPAAPALA